MKYFATALVTVDRGDHGQAFGPGDELVDVPASTIASMRRVGLAVPEASGIPGALTPVDQDDSGSDPVDAAEPVVDSVPLQDLPVIDLGLSPHAASALKAAGITTVGEVLAHGEEHDTLTGITGIGNSTEAAIKKAIEQVAE